MIHEAAQMRTCQRLSPIPCSRVLEGASFAPSDDTGSDGLPKKARILVVEDDHLVAMNIESALLDAGMVVTGIASTAEKAVELGEATRPDLAVMDIRLAGKRDGVEAALELFERFGIRCVFASAHYDEATRKRAEPARPLAWIPKPYQTDALVRAVHEVLAK